MLFEFPEHEPTNDIRLTHSPPSAVLKTLPGSAAQRNRVRCLCCDRCGWSYFTACYQSHEEVTPHNDRRQLLRQHECGRELLFFPFKAQMVES